MHDPPMGYDLRLPLSCLAMHIPHRVAGSLVQIFPSHSFLQSKVIQLRKGL